MNEHANKKWSPKLTDIGSPIDGVADKLRLKVRQLYTFLKEANQIQFRPVRKLSDQQYVIRIADLPKHPSAQLFRPVKVENSLEVPDVHIRVSRPKLTRCPSPPESCTDWLLPNWDDPYLTPEIAASKNKHYSEFDEDGNEEETTITIVFTDDPMRVYDYAEWLEHRKKWAEPELIALGAMRYFENFYTLYSRIEKEGEKLELLVADGVLSWNTESGIDGAVSIQHPIVFKRVELRFNPNIPEFTVHETDREVELYNNLFLDLKEVESVSIRNRKEELENSGYHPLGWEDTSAFLDIDSPSDPVIVGDMYFDNEFVKNIKDNHNYREGLLVGQVEFSIGERSENFDGIIYVNRSHVIHEHYVQNFEFRVFCTDDLFHALRNASVESLETRISPKIEE